MLLNLKRTYASGINLEYHSYNSTQSYLSVDYIYNYGSNPIRLALEIIAIITLASLEP